MVMANIHVKVDSEIKAETESVLEQIGVSMSDLVNMTMRRVIIERRIPFDTTVPDIEMPDKMTIKTEKEWQKLIDKRIKNDDGSRYTIQEVRKILRPEKVRANL